MSGGWFALLGVVLGGSIGLFATWLQLRHDARQRRISRALNVYKDTIQAGCEMLAVFTQERAADAQAVQDWERRLREAFVSHWRTVGLLRLHGDLELAEKAVELFDYVTNAMRRRRDYLNTDEGWSDVRSRAYSLIQLMEERMRALEYEASVSGAVGQVRALIRARRRRT